MADKLILDNEYSVLTNVMVLVENDALPEIKKHSQAKLYPSEVVTIGMLRALKGVSYREFYRW